MGRLAYRFFWRWPVLRRRRRVGAGPSAHRHRRRSRRARSDACRAPIPAASSSPRCATSCSTSTRSSTSSRSSRSATRPRPTARPSPSSCGPGVKFHDGEPLDAEAAKYSIDRHLTMKGSFRKPEIGTIDSVEVADPLTIKLHLKAPFSPLLAQLTDRAGMMVSPKAAEAAGDKFGLKPVCAGPYKFVERVQQDRIVVEKFADYWNKDQVFIDKITYLPIVDTTVRLANLRPAASTSPSASWRPTSRRCGRSQAQARQLGVARLVRPDDQPGQRAEVEQSAGQGSARAQGVRAQPRPRRHQPGRLQRRVRAGQPVGQPAEPVLSKGLPGPQARHRQGQGADEGGRHHRQARRSTTW